MPRHVVILPYYCDDEVGRYLKIADWISENCRLPLDCTFLLAASPRTTPSDRMLEAWTRIGPCQHLHCPTQTFGYPEGPTAMFWDSIDEVARSFSGDGFALWMESDMVPARSDWLAVLTAEWDREPERPLLMGCYIPAVYRNRWPRPRKMVIAAHVNGGACYALDFARRIPPGARTGIFDLAVYDPARSVGPVVATESIGFSTLASVRSDVAGGRRAVLHGYLQDKDRFISEAARPVTTSERIWAGFLSGMGWWTALKRRTRIALIRKGPGITLERAILAQKDVVPGRIPVAGSP